MPGNRRCASNGGKREQAEANSPSFYPILESECLAPLTLETGCTAESYTPPHFPLPIPLLLLLLLPPFRPSFLAHHLLLLYPPLTCLSLLSLSLSSNLSTQTINSRRNASSWPDWDSLEILDKIPATLLRGFSNSLRCYSPFSLSLLSSPCCVLSVGRFFSPLPPTCVD